MALGSTQPLIEMSIRNLPGGKGGRRVRLTTSPPSVSLFLLRDLQSAIELYRPSDRRMSAKLVPTFADRGCRVVSATDPPGR
jgi:hypothetical protein